MNHEFTRGTQEMKKARLNPRIKQFGLAVAAVAMLTVGAVPRAHATLMLTLSDGNPVNDITVTDDDADGVVIFNGALGSWIVNVTTGISKPVVGGIADPVLDLNSINVSGSTGTLTLELTDDGFDLGTGWHSASYGIGGTTDGTVSFEALLNTTTIGSGLISAAAFPPVGVFSVSGGKAVNVTAPFSLSNIASITHTGVGQVTSFDFIVKVPEPGPLLLLGIALAGVGLGRRWLRANLF